MTMSTSMSMKEKVLGRLGAGTVLFPLFLPYLHFPLLSWETQLLCRSWGSFMKTSIKIHENYLDNT